MPMATANCTWVSPTKRRKAAMSSPDSICPSMRRFRTRTEMARENCSSVSSGISVIGVHPCLVLPTRPSLIPTSSSFPHSRTTTEPSRIFHALPNPRLFRWRRAGGDRQRLRPVEQLGGPLRSGQSGDLQILLTGHRDLNRQKLDARAPPSRSTRAKSLLRGEAKPRGRSPAGGPSIVKEPWTPPPPRARLPNFPVS